MLFWGENSWVQALLEHTYISYKAINKPTGSMYAIYGNIYHQYTPNVSETCSESESDYFDNGNLLN